MKTEQRWLISVIGGITIFRLIYINLVPLLPQEAYYWKYAKQLALSYFDHPPLTAYLIAFFTWLGGDRVFFIRLGSVLCSVGLMLLLYGITCRLFLNKKSALTTVVLLNSTVLFSICATIITPDVPLLLFWAWIVYCLVRLQESQQEKWWYLAGIGLGFALLSKYTAVLIVPGIFVWVLVSHTQRKWLLTLHPYLGTLIALVIFSPVLVWNYQHDWVSFLFQSSRKISAMESLRVDFFLQLLGTQLGMLTPYIFFLVIIGWVQAGKEAFKEHNEKLSLLFWVAFPVYLVFTLSSLRSLVKMNWMAPAHIASMIAGIVWLHTADTAWSHRLKKWFKPGLALGLTLVLFMHMLPLTPLFPMRRDDTWTGWKELAPRVVALKKEMGPNTFVFGHEHKIPSEITFYTPTHERTHAGEVIGINGFQYNYWTNTDELLRKDAIFVTSDADRFKYMDYLAARFERVVAEPPLEIRYHNRIFRIFYLYRCYGYKGPQPGVKGQG